MHRKVFSFLLVLLFFNCFGRKIEEPNNIYKVKARLLNINDWISKTDLEIVRLKKQIRIQKRYYLVNNPSIYDIMNENYESMKDIIFDVKGYRNQIIELIEIIDTSDLDSLDSLTENQIEFDQKINLVFSEFIKSKKEYLKSKEGLKRALRRDLKKFVFLKDKTNQWKNDFFEMSLDRLGLDQSITKFETELNLMIFDNDYDNRKKIKKLSRRIQRYTNRLNEIETYVDKLDSIALREIGGWVYVIGFREKKPDFEVKYKKYKKEYRKIIRNISFELKEI